MKFNVIKNFKLFLIITLSVLVVGMIFLGVFGFNQTVNASDNYELYVSVDSYTPSTEDSGASNTRAVMEKAIEDYFEKVDVAPSCYATQTLIGDGLTLVYKFSEDVSDKVSTIKEYVQAEITEKAVISGLTVDADFKYVAESSISDVGFGWIILAMGITAVILFIYNCFIEKFAGAISVLGTSVLSSILFVAVMCIVRIPAAPTVGVTFALSFIISSVLSSTMVNRYREQLKMVQTEKSTVVETINKATMSSVVRLVLSGAVLLIVALLLVAIGPAHLRFLGLQLLVCDIVSIYSAFVCTPITYYFLKKESK